MTLDTAPGWEAQTRASGVLLEHESVDRDVALVTTSTLVPAENEGLLVADVREGEGLLVRPSMEQDQDAALLDGILGGHVGAEVHALDGEASIFPYGGLNVTVSTGTERLVALLDAERDQGQSLVVHLDREEFPDARALLDGDPLPQSDTIRAALEPGQESHAFVTSQGETTTVVVGVNEFSTRDVIVEAVPQAGAFLTVGTFLASAAIVSLAGWGLFRRS